MKKNEFIVLILVLFTVACNNKTSDVPLNTIQICAATKDAEPTGFSLYSEGNFIVRSVLEPNDRGELCSEKYTYTEPKRGNYTLVQIATYDEIALFVRKTNNSKEKQVAFPKIGNNHIYIISNNTNIKIDDVSEDI